MSRTSGKLPKQQNEIDRSERGEAKLQLTMHKGGISRIPTVHVEGYLQLAVFFVADARVVLVYAIHVVNAGGQLNGIQEINVSAVTTIFECRR